ncbi:hypothetical protein EHI8A_124690 [Entamoeba histolytica HM-1:IMSS-B]|uniref:Uncharacterized protein n=6 Tax=Entamoeba histolytica TaxID=5759 RepID=C4M2V2_ENTH1|nr:hypothetical protein EHI_188850 [Entamoeba histolytica HM-1:IMSS]EMD43636.1 histone H1, putative [Entamoeba histolytica KU27]EMH76676.1 hypothetical protein EHI8A_124690 [Entamoeba histolytica HM-1:IMSS-B]EMS15508.1 histone H1, putative [Entamoeba histolytica HM-3:IMSS]ENY61488.1 histone H1, putative [Entamoeba histolytica HM-1:IMSS-A]GAT95623.1 hypothetical protein CL6EHI_188850 [Entamoeba histolytica]|eukprot:XP_656660.1 hypothetical protein EHI_188850 [Entamoeba histolytica HM-1:IMSS]
MKGFIVSILLISLASAVVINEEAIKKDPLYKQYSDAMNQIDKAVGEKAQKEISKKMSLKAKFNRKIKLQLARKAKKMAKKIEYVSKVKKMNKVIRKSMKEIKPNTDIKKVLQQVKSQLQLIAGKDTKAIKKMNKLIKKFDKQSQRKVAHIVKKLQKKVQLKKAKKAGLKIGPTEKKLAQKAIKYVQKANERMGKSEKYIELSCKSSPKYCSFFKKSFVVANPIVV